MGRSTDSWRNVRRPRSARIHTFKRRAQAGDGLPSGTVACGAFGRRGVCGTARGVVHGVNVNGVTTSRPLRRAVSRAPSANSSDVFGRRWRTGRGRTDEAASADSSTATRKWRGRLARFVVVNHQLDANNVALARVQVEVSASSRRGRPSGAGPSNRADPLGTCDVTMRRTRSEPPFGTARRNVCSGDLLSSSLR
jgi:hypothetical protein